MLGVELTCLIGLLSETGASMPLQESPPPNSASSLYCSWDYPRCAWYNDASSTGLEGTPTSFSSETIPEIIFWLLLTAVFCWLKQFLPARTDCGRKLSHSSFLRTQFEHGVFSSHWKSCKLGSCICILSIPGLSMLSLLHGPGIAVQSQHVHYPLVCRKRIGWKSPFVCLTIVLCTNVVVPLPTPAGFVFSYMIVSFAVQNLATRWNKCLYHASKHPHLKHYVS